MFTVGLGPIADSFFVAATMIIAIPTGVKIFNWLATMWGGSIRFTTAMLFSLGLVAVFTVGGLSGIMHASAPVNLQQHDSYFVVAHFHYVIVGGAMMGLWAGLYYWFPKVSGRFLSEKLGQWHFWTTMVGFNLTFFPMHFSGLFGMPRRIYTYSADLNVAIYNQLATVGALIFAVSAVIMVVNIVKSWRSGEKAGANPWDAPHLEWSIPSPPHHYNFPELPNVQSREPLWNAGEREQILAVTMGEAKEEPHMPNPSYWPILLAASITLAWALVMTGVWWIIALGIIPVFFCTLMWGLEPAFPEGH